MPLGERAVTILTFSTASNADMATICKQLTAFVRGADRRDGLETMVLVVRPKNAVLILNKRELKE